MINNRISACCEPLMVPSRLSATAAWPAADGCCELLDGVEDGVAVGLLFLAQPVQTVGHDVAEA